MNFKRNCIDFKRNCIDFQRNCIDLKRNCIDFQRVALIPKGFVLISKAINCIDSKRNCIDSQRNSIHFKKNCIDFKPICLKICPVESSIFNLQTGSTDVWRFVFYNLQSSIFKQARQMIEDLSRGVFNLQSSITVLYINN